MGDFDVTVDHLASVMEQFTKDKHNLCPLTIRPRDRQNFDSVLRISHERVIDLLTHIEGTEGTVLYLRVLDNVLRAFLDLTLTPIERVRRIWFSVFILRLWKEFILRSSKKKFKARNHSKKKFKAQNHFLSMYCYACVEINAHALVFIILYLKEKKLDHLFHIQLLGSQPCESFFRQIRSFTSTYSTVVNCSSLEIIRRISKIELQNEISHVKLKSFTFPRLGLPSSSYYSREDRNGSKINENVNIVELPSKTEIINEIELAKLEAVEYAESIGMRVNNANLVCRFTYQKPRNNIRKAKLTKTGTKLTNTAKNRKTKVTKPIFSKKPKQKTANNIRTTAENQETEPDETVLRLFKDVDFKPYAKKVNPIEIDENSLYVKVRNKTGEILFVEKHTLCWFLSKSMTKLSSCRLARSMAK